MERKIVIAIVIYFSCIGLLFSQETKIESNDFIMEYKNHEIRADTKYYGKKVVISGLCDEFNIFVDPRIGEFRNQGYSYVPSVTMYLERGNFFKGAVIFHFSNEQKELIAGFDIGSKMIIEGTVYKCNGPYIYIVDCKVIQDI